MINDNPLPDQLFFCDDTADDFDYCGGEVEHQVGCDLVEVSPPYDTTGNTSLTAGQRSYWGCTQIM